MISEIASHAILNACLAEFPCVTRSKSRQWAIHCPGMSLDGAKIILNAIEGFILC